jgi:hypothetical protein
VKRHDAKKRPKWEEAALRLLIDRLDVNSPGFCGTEEVAEALGDRMARIYISSWVIPVIEALLGGEQFHGQKGAIVKDEAATRRIAVERVAGKREWKFRPAGRIAT